MIKRIKSTLPIIATTVLALLMLVYVGYGETLRTAPKFEKAKLQAQAEVIQTAMEAFLQSGLPLKQFIGFDQLAQSILDTDKTIQAIVVRKMDGTKVFDAGQADAPLLPSQDISDIVQKTVNKAAIDASDNNNFRHILLLRNKFETLGVLEIVSPTQTMSARITAKFKSLIPALGLIVALVFVVSYVSAAYQKSSVWLQEIAFGLAFLAAAGVMVATVLPIYSDGVQSKTRALADSLASRLGIISELQLDFNDFSGIDRMIADYQKLNPDIKTISVNFNSKIRFNTDTAKIGTVWQPDPEAYEHTARLKNAANSQIDVSVGIAKKTVYRAIVQNIKSFISLFVATGFMAVLFIQLSATLQHKVRAIQDPQARQHDYDDMMLQMIKPVYLIGVFVETLNASFLPQYLRSILSGETVGQGASAAIFAVFFVFFAAVLVPAGKFAETRGAKPLLLVGALLCAVAQFMLANAFGLEIALIARALSGAGQGIFLIGIQSFILEHSTGGKTTQGTGIIVYGFNGGMISGAAIGSLLSVYMGISGVFYCAAIIAIILFVYVYMLVPARTVTPEQTEVETEPGTQKRPVFQIFHDIFSLLKDLEFMKTILFVGIPTKAILSGVSIYALPLILAEFGYENDSIGQVIMFYAAGVLLASHFVSKLVDRVRKTVLTLLIGCLVGGVGLLLIGLLGSDLDALGLVFANREAVLVVTGMFILGISHGFINAPVVTHVVTTDGVNKVGKATSVATYRFIERIGHVIGPIVVAAILSSMGGSPLAIMYIGGAIVVFGLLFSLPVGRAKPAKPQWSV